MDNMGLLRVFITMLMVLTTLCYSEHYGRVVFTAKRRSKAWVQQRPVIYVKTAYLLDKNQTLEPVISRVVTPRKQYLLTVRRSSKPRDKQILANKMKSKNGIEPKQIINNTKLENKTEDKKTVDQELEGFETSELKSNWLEDNDVQPLTPNKTKRGNVWNDSVINYYFDKKSYDELVRKKVIKSFEEIEGATCLQFRRMKKKPTDASFKWIHITNPHNDRNCHHESMPKEDETEIILTFGLDCLRQQQILHTLLHAIGLRDEITHPQRSRYVRVFYENIKLEHHELFEIKYDNDSTPLVEFDSMSVMLFHDRAYSKNGHATIAAKVPGLQIAPSEKLSHLDKLKLRAKFSHLCNKNNPY